MEHMRRYSSGGIFDFWVMLGSAWQLFVAGVSPHSNISRTSSLDEIHLKASPILLR
jgi:hypothetical protein